MKKLFAILLCTALLGTFAMGCTSENPVDEPAADAPAAEAEPTAEAPDDDAGSGDAGAPTAPSNKVVWIASHMQNEFVVDMAANAELAGEEAGWEVVVMDPNLDLNTQISQIETAAAQDYAAILFDPISFDGMNAVVESVMNDYDIPVITIHGSAACQDLLTAYVAVDLTKGGELKMEQVIKDLDGAGEIAVMTGTEGQTSAILVTTGYENVLEGNDDIEVVFQASGEWNADDATPLAENWLSSGKNIDAIVCNNDGMALGVRAVLKNSGLTGDVKLYGLDATKEGRAAIRAGEMDASIWVDSYAEFVEAFSIINKFYAGESFEKEVMVVPTLVTIDNIDELFPDD